MSSESGGKGGMSVLNIRRSHQEQAMQSRQSNSVNTGGIVVTYGEWPRPHTINQPESSPAYWTAKRILKHRRSVDQAFHFTGLSTSPAWEILLDLYVAEENCTRVSIKSACIASCAPATTALRWLKVLEVKSLIVRRSDPLDRRRSYVSLSDEARQKLKGVLASL